MSFLNRCLIAGANNLIGLSIPVDGGRQQKGPMKEIRVSRTEPWQQQHWKSLQSAYNRSPFFDHYAEELGKMYQSRQVFLQDWNRLCLEWIKSKTGWSPELSFIGSETATYQVGENDRDPGKQITDWRNRMQPKNYHQFSCPVYRQVFEDSRGFLPNLSILDLLFNTGPGASLILRTR